jgi:hypothetical protein
LRGLDSDGRDVFFRVGALQELFPLTAVPFHIVYDITENFAVDQLLDLLELILGEETAKNVRAQTSFQNYSRFV